jgi:hypothetical protein
MRLVTLQCAPLAKGTGDGGRIIAGCHGMGPMHLRCHDASPVTDPKCDCCGGDNRGGDKGDKRASFHQRKVGRHAARVNPPVLASQNTRNGAALPDLARDKSGRDRPAGGGRVAPAGRSQPDYYCLVLRMSPCPAACAAGQPSRASLHWSAASAGRGVEWLGTANIENTAVEALQG